MKCSLFPDMLRPQIYFLKLTLYVHLECFSHATGCHVKEERPKYK